MERSVGLAARAGGAAPTRPQSWSQLMSEQIPDPARWLADLMKAQHTVLWPAGDIFTTSAETLAAAATSWTKAVADLTAWQLGTLQQMAAAWTGALPGAAALPGAGAAADP